MSAVILPLPLMGMGMLNNHPRVAYRSIRGLPIFERVRS